jgi:hypothetical protein
MPRQSDLKLAQYGHTRPGARQTFIDDHSITQALLQIIQAGAAKEDCKNTRIGKRQPECEIHAQWLQNHTI